jgi:hypothetical protein
MLHPWIVAELARQRQAELIAESRRDALAREVRLAGASSRPSYRSTVRRAAVAVGTLLAAIVLFVGLPGHGA